MKVTIMIMEGVRIMAKITEDESDDNKNDDGE